MYQQPYIGDPFFQELVDADISIRKDSASLPKSLRSTLLTLQNTFYAGDPQTGYIEASDILIQTLFLDPSNTFFMDFCRNDHVFSDLVDLLKGFPVEDDLNVLPDSLFDDFLRQIAPLPKELRLCITCELADLLSDSARKKLRVMVLQSLDILSVRGLYFAIASGILQYDQSILKLMINMIACAKPELLQSQTLENPVYVLNLLSRYCLISKENMKKTLMRNAE